MPEGFQVGGEVQHLVKALDFYSKGYERFLEIVDENERCEAIKKAVNDLGLSKLSIGAVNIAVRKAIIDIVKRHGSNNKKAVDSMGLLLDMTLELINMGWCSTAQRFNDSSLALTIIEDSLDLITVDWLGDLIKNFEVRKSLTSFIDPNKNKGLMLLRILNESQRRLSKTKYSYLSGWFLTYISNLFPLSERSGVNLRGEFNVKNGYPQINDIEIQDEFPIFTDENNKTLYEYVVKLQNFLLYPPSVLESGNLPIFKMCLKKFLDALKHERSRPLDIKFEPYNLDEAQTSEIEEHSNQKEEATLQEEEATFRRERTALQRERTTLFLDKPRYFSGLYLPEQFNMRTYTLKDNIHTQVHFIPFVRHILTSAYFVLQYLLSTLNNAPSDGEKETNDMEVEYDWIGHSITRTLKYLNFKQPKDKTYVKALELISKHEMAWAEWKKNSCQKVEPEEAIITSGGFNKKVKLSVSDSVRYPDQVGINELSNIWEVSSHSITTLKDPDYTRPYNDVHDILAPYLEHLTPVDRSTHATLVNTPINSNNGQVSPVPSNSSNVTVSTNAIDPSNIASSIPLTNLWRSCRVALRNNYEIFCPSEEDTTQPQTNNIKSSDLVKILLGDLEDTYKFKPGTKDSTAYK